MKKNNWKNEGLCLGYDTDIFFDKYENDESLRAGVDALCNTCPVQRQCFAVGISGKEWGVWGGIYIENGEISREFNRHKTKVNWGNTWQSLTMEN
jgi:hypothetical protein